jgi:hypothetical protein
MMTLIIRGLRTIDCFRTSVIELVIVRMQCEGSGSRSGESDCDNEFPGEAS